MIRIIIWYHAVYDLSRYVATVKVRIKANVKIFIPWQTLLYIKWNNITTIICKSQKVISVTDGRGNTVNYSYDKEGQQITEKMLQILFICVNSIEIQALLWQNKLLLLRGNFQNV